MNTVTTHHDQCCGTVGDVRQDGVGNVDIGCRDCVDFDLDIMAREMFRHFGAANDIRIGIGFLVQHNQQIDRGCLD